ncbi:MAG: hypothetical protein WC851_01090 [Candidatus Shapirobacteria bacterium]
MKRTNRPLRIFVVLLGIMLFLAGLFLVVSVIPSKVTVENFRLYSTLFPNLSEKQKFEANFVSIYPGLERIDVLFKNPNLESRDELKIKILRNSGEIVYQQDFSGFNFGDTSHARLDFPKGTVRKGENLSVLVELTKVIDGKLMVGTKNGELNFIQYYNSNTAGAVVGRMVNTLNKVVGQPIVVLLPIAFGVMTIW